MADHSQMKLGRKGVKIDYRTFKLTKYVLELPDPPDQVDHTKGKTSWGMMLNDVYGDCTIAGCGHLVQLWTLNTQPQMTTVPDTTILDLYSKWDGYKPNDPSTDNGGYLLDVLNDWRRDTFAGSTLDAFVSVNPQNLRHTKQATSLFGGLYIGVELPVSCQRQDVWDVVSNDGGMWGGHCVAICGYNPTGPVCITWGENKQMTWAFWQKYCDEAYALLDKDYLGNFAPNIDETALMNDLQAVTGEASSKGIFGGKGKHHKVTGGKSISEKS